MICTWCSAMCMLVLVKCMHVGRHDRQPDHEQRCCFLGYMNVLYLWSSTRMSLSWYTASQLASCIKSLLMSEIKNDQQPYWANQLCVQYVCVNGCNNSIHIPWCIYFFSINVIKQSRGNLCSQKWLCKDLSADMLPCYKAKLVNCRHFVANCYQMLVY